MRALSTFGGLLFIWGLGGGFFGGAILLLSTAIWPVSPLSAFISANLGALVLSFIIAASTDI